MSSLRRLLDTRRRINEHIWATRSVVIAAQLRQLRGTW